MNDETLQRYIEGYSSRQEKEEMAEWILSNEENKRHYLLLRRLYDAIIMSDPNISDASDEKHQLPTAKPIFRRMLYEVVKIAAVFLIFFGIYHFLLPDKQGMPESAVSMVTLHVPDGQRTEITLADGTKVWLNANTTLTFPSLFLGKERKVELNGEAYFEVTHNESKKFIVQTEPYQVNVLGTEFNVKAYRQNQGFETSLVRGSVEIASSQTGEKLRLTPDQRAYFKDGHLAIATLPNHDHFLWKEGILVFEYKSIREIFDELQLYFDVKIEVKNKKLPNTLFTGKFRTKDGIEHVLKVLQHRHKFNYTKDSELNKIVIY
jgi:ferric-dicitrate binding protein FerR (iron transport regulator)